MSYQPFIETLIKQQSLRDSDLNRVNKIQDQMQEASLPLLLVKLGLCSEKDVASALGPSCRIEKCCHRPGCCFFKLLPSVPAWYNKASTQ